MKIAAGIRQKQTHKAFYISIALLVRFVTLGEDEKEGKKCDSRSLNGEVTTRLETRSPDKSSEEHLHTTECSISTLYHTLFVIT